VARLRRHRLNLSAAPSSAASDSRDAPEASLPRTGAATLIVVAQIGIWATGKHSRNAELMIDAGEAFSASLETLRAGQPKRKSRPSRTSRRNSR